MRAMLKFIGSAVPPVRLTGPDHEPLPYVRPVAALAVIAPMPRHRAGRGLPGLMASLIALTLIAAAATKDF